MSIPPWLDQPALAFSAQVTPADPAQAPAQVTIPGGIPDAVTGTDAADGGQQTAEQLDQALTAQLADQLTAAWPDLDDQTREAYRRALPGSLAAAAAAAGQIAFRVPSGTAEPGAGTILVPGRIGPLLTGAFGPAASVDGVLALTADQLRQSQLGLERIFTDNDENTAQMLLGPNPDDEDPDMLASLQMLTDDLNGASGGGQPPAGPEPVSHAGTSGMKIKIPQAWRDAIGPARQTVQRAWGAGAPPSAGGLPGNMAHALIQSEYLRTYPANDVLIDKGFRPGGAKASLAPFDPAKPDPVLAPVLAALALGRKQPSEPDILDLTTRRVYEIKPIRKIREGVVQLFSNYLLPLNTALLTEAVARQMLDVLSPVSGDPSGWANPGQVDLSELWLPGLWTPPPFIQVSIGLYIWVIRPMPGLILYKYVWRRKPIEKVSDIAAVIAAFMATDTAQTIVLGAAAATLRPGLAPSDLATTLANMAGLNPAAFAANCGDLAALLPPPPDELSWNAIFLAAAAVVTLTVALIVTAGGAGAALAGGAGGTTAIAAGTELTTDMGLEEVVAELISRKAA